MEENKMSAVAISDLLRDTLNKTNDLISDLESVKINVSEEDFEDLNPVIDSIIEDNNNHIGKLQQLVDMLSGDGEIVEDGKYEAIELIDNSDEFMESMTTMSKKLRLNENFDNVIDDVQAVADPVFVGANEEHDENKKKYEDAMKENKKNAEETIPEEGDTGKKITSSDLKAMHLSEALFSESISQDFVEWCGENIAEYILTEFTDLQNSDIRKVLKWVINHFSGPDFEESLKESLDFSDYSDFNSAVYNALADVMFSFESKNVEKSDMDKALEWFDTHFWESDGDEFETKKMNHMTGVRESLEEDLAKGLSRRMTNEENACVNDMRVALFGVIDALNKYEMKYGQPLDDELVKWTFNSVLSKVLNESLNESLQVGIAKEQIKRFAEGKMPKNWNVDSYLKKLTENKHITSKEAKSLKEWYKNEQKR